jgi:hypothetical protein
MWFEWPPINNIYAKFCENQSTGSKVEKGTNIQMYSIFIGFSFSLRNTDYKLSHE